MQNYSKIYNRIWQHKRFRLMSDSAKTLYLYMLSCPHGNSLGFYFLPTGYITSDLNWGKYKVRTNIIELVSNGFISWCDEAKMVRILRFLKFQPLANPNVVSAAIYSLNSIPTPSTSLLKELLSDIYEEMKDNKKPYYDKLAECIEFILNSADERKQAFIYGSQKKMQIPQVISNDLSSEEESWLLSGSSKNDGKNELVMRKDFIHNEDLRVEIKVDQIVSDVEPVETLSMKERLKNNLRKPVVINTINSNNNGIDTSVPSDKKIKPTVVAKILLEDNTYYEIHDSMLTKLMNDFKNINIEDQLLKMNRWCESNPRKRKTRSGVMRFINNWLENASIREAHSSLHATTLNGLATNEVNEIFNFWKESMEIVEAVLTNERHDLIKKALVSYKKEILMEAISGCRKSSWHQGDNDKKMKYNDLRYIIMDPSKIEQFVQRNRIDQKDNEYITGDTPKSNDDSSDFQSYVDYVTR